MLVLMHVVGKRVTVFTKANLPQLFQSKAYDSEGFGGHRTDM